MSKSIKIQKYFIDLGVLKLKGIINLGFWDFHGQWTIHNCPCTIRVRVRVKLLPIDPNPNPNPNCPLKKSQDPKIILT